MRHASLVLQVLGMMLLWVAKIGWAVIIIVCGFRRRHPIERRPWHVGPQRNWTNEPF